MKWMLISQTTYYLDDNDVLFFVTICVIKRVSLLIMDTKLGHERKCWHDLRDGMRVISGRNLSTGKLSSIIQKPG